MSSLAERLRSARLYLVCDRPQPGFLDAALRGGVDIVQLRSKRATDAETLAAAHVVRAACAEHQALFILNDRPDLVDAADADGVHLGQDDTPVAQARERLGHARLIGLSTHSPAQVDSAVSAGVDYIGVGPVFETPTKPGRPAVGLELVRYAAERSALPFFAIGGIGARNIRAVRDAGAKRVAVVRALTGAEDPGGVAAELRAALSNEEVLVGSAQS